MPKAPNAVARLYRLSSIDPSPRFQVRGGTDQNLVNRYAKAMADGDNFPPIDLAQIGNKLYVIDGHHRLKAAGAADLMSISGTQHRMSVAEAHLYALAANNTHGKQMTSKDKQAAFKGYIDADLHLDEWGLPKSLDAIWRDCPLYSRGNVWKLLKARGINARRKEPAPYRPAYRDDEGPSPEDLEEEDAIMLASFNKHLDAATVSYDLLSDGSRSMALGVLKALVDDLQASTVTQAPTLEI